jgi:hypothetical protein
MGCRKLREFDFPQPFWIRCTILRVAPQFRSASWQRFMAALYNERLQSLHNPAALYGSAPQQETVGAGCMAYHSTASNP